MEIEKILNRIDIFEDKSSLEPNFENLKKLKEAYILNVPYENLDFALNRGFSANILKIYEKIVENNRGGICYESNTLFMYLLSTLGYKVKMIFAKVMDLTYIGVDYPHLALIVSLDEEDYLVDVANGQNVREPMPLHNEKFIAHSEDIEYKIEVLENEYALLFNNKKRGWYKRYTFTQETKRVSDFANVFEDEKNFEKFSNHAPLLVTKALANGRVTLTNDLISVKNDGDKRAWNISLENRAEVLRDYFDIHI